MNKNERERKKELDRKIENIDNEIYKINIFFKEAIKIFKTKESLEALKEIIEAANKKEQELKDLIEEASTIEENCNHEFLLEGGNTFCLICGKHIHKYPEESLLSIKIDEIIYIGDSSLLYAIENKENYFLRSKEDEKFLKKLSDKIDESIDEEDFIYETCNYLQNHENIKIKRLKL